MGMGRNGKSLMGIPWEWELVTKLAMGRNGNRLHGNGREWECKKPFRASLLGTRPNLERKWIKCWPVNKLKVEIVAVIEVNS